MPNSAKWEQIEFDDGNPLADKETPRAMKHQQGLLFGRLGSDNPHVWPL
jgi:hypothetical protein